MKILIYVGDLVTDVPGIFLGGLIARNLQADVTLLHVSPKRRGKKAEKKDGKQLLEQVRKDLSDLHVKTHVRRGNVAQKILAEVQEKQIDMVVITASRIGSYPRHESISIEDLSKIHCCVVIAKNPRPKIKQILMLTGGLHTSEPMIKIGVKLACALGANVTLMHVAANVPSMYTGLNPLEETLEQLLQTDTPVAKHFHRCARLLDKLNVPSDLKLRHGEPVYEIIREIDQEDYDLVLLGASGVSNGLKEWFMGNLTKEIIKLVGIPVVVVNQGHEMKINATAS
jgi:nucleotide-binding universal stress UspA family protein